MSLAPWRPSRLTRAQQEERRLAVQPFLADPSRTNRDLAQQFGIAEVTVRVWRARLRHRGEHALRASRSTGRPHHLSAEQQAVIQAIIEDDPREHGFDTSAWTTLRIREVIGVKFGVWLNRGHLSRKLRAWGFSYQRPAVRAVERNEEEVATWIRVQGEALGKKNR